MGSVFARGNQLYMAYKTVAGAWKQRPTGYTVGQEKEAEKFLKQLETQVAAAIALGEREEGPLTVRRYHERWSDRRRAKGVASAKDDDARVRLHVLPAVIDSATGQSFGDLVLDEVKPRHAREVVDALVAKMKAGDLAPRSVRHAFFAVRTMFEHAVTLDERLASNPCVLPKGYLPGKQDKDPTWRPSAKFSHAEVEQLIEDGRVPKTGVRFTPRCFYRARASASWRRSQSLTTTQAWRHWGS